MSSKPALLLALLLIQSAASNAAVAADTNSILQKKNLPLPGEVFQVGGHVAFVIPAKANPAIHAKPWVWYAPTLPGLPGPEERWMFEQFLDAGISIAGIDVGESYGSPPGRKLFTALHQELTGSRGYSARPVMLGRSRGGLMALSWAAENPEKTGAFAGIYPVCNIASYPGVAKAASAYEMLPEELQAHLTEHNPIDRLQALARAGLPLFAIHGNVDTVVPLEKNSGLLKERYMARGGSMQLIIPPSQGHNMWIGFFQCRELVSFVKAHSGPIVTLTSPLDYQVIQRSSRKSGSIVINGEFGDPLRRKFTVEARLIANGTTSRWQRVSASSKTGNFEARLNSPAGGWHRVELRVLSRDAVLAETVVEHVGIGEVFVIAGQSNSANHGSEKQKTASGKVAAFDGRRWHPAEDPQPGASGNGGSFMPPFGDDIADKFHVPVGIVACGVGATSVREWLPKGATFPNPPTLTNNVRQVSGGAWESKGTIFANFATRMKQLEPHGFRAVLWHQGESDANQNDATRTLPGSFYREYLGQLIRESRREIGWKAPWFVAQASYHVPGDEASADIRAAQASLWKIGLALQGPDTDALKSEFRDNEGRGVHFNGRGLREHAARWTERVSVWLEKQLR